MLPKFTLTREMRRKQQDYGKAREHYTQALQTTDRTLEGKVKYNLGNVEYQQAYKTQQPQAAMPHLRSAMTYYRDSLDVDPQQQDARVIIWNSPICYYCTNCNRSNNSQNRSSNRGSPKTSSSKINNKRPSKMANSRASSNRASGRMESPQQTPSPDPQQSQQQQAAASKPQGQQAEQPQDASQDNAPSLGQQTAAQRELRPEEAARLLEGSGSGAVRHNQRQQRRAKTRLASGQRLVKEGHGCASPGGRRLMCHVRSPQFAAIIACCLYLLCAVQHATGAVVVSVQARLADADIYLGESTSLELRINGIRNPEPPDLTHPDIDITKAGGQSFNNSSYTMINGQIRQTEEFGYVARYLLWPRRAGTLEIPPLTMVHEGQTYRSNPVTLRVQRPPEQDFLRVEVSPNKPSYVLGETVT